jgi:hypothetical protein
MDLTSQLYNLFNKFPATVIANCLEHMKEFSIT